MSETEKTELNAYLTKDMANQLNEVEAELAKAKTYIAQLEADNRGLAARLQAIALVMRP